MSILRTENGLENVDLTPAFLAVKQVTILISSKSQFLKSMADSDSRYTLFVVYLVNNWEDFFCLKKIKIY